MRIPFPRVSIGPTLRASLAILAAWAGLCGLAHGQLPEPLTDRSQATALDERLRRLEEMNVRLLEQLKRDREESARRYSELDERYRHDSTESARRYKDLEDRYRELGRHVGEPRPDAEAGRTEEPAEPTTRSSHHGRPGEAGRFHPMAELPLKARLADGFQLASEDEEFDLRFHVLDQTDYKFFSPNDMTYGKSGVYVPRVRVYFEGRLTRNWDYEVSLQRSLDGNWDLLDGNINLRLAEGFQIKLGRCLVPYSFDWFDHLEQYFIAPERALFPLNFGLSRQAGVMAWGNAADGRLDWAIGGFNGHLSGVTDNNPDQEAVGYFNFRPFLNSAGYTPLRHLNIGASGSLGQVVRDETPLPLRTSVQAAENDAATTDASAVFLNFNDGTVYHGTSDFAAVHLAYYFQGLSFESEWNLGQVQMSRPGLQSRPEIPVRGFHAMLSYFITGEQIERRTTVVPLRPFRPFSGECGPGAIEPFVRYSQLSLGDTVFRDGLANGEFWTNKVGMVDLGVNWYPNQWIKFYIDWQHAAYGSPVLINPRGIFSRSSDLFWLRCQFYF
jgi:phosphate-selective porin OprO/OprP